MIMTPPFTKFYHPDPKQLMKPSHLFLVPLVLLYVLALPLTGHCTAASFKIGLILDQSGKSRVDQHPILQAVELAVTKIGADHRFGNMNIQLEIFDNGGSVIGSKLAALKAVRSGVPAVIGPMRSSNALISAEVLQKAGIVMITPTATHPEITKERDFVFRTCYTDRFQGDTLSKFACSELNAKKTVVLTNTKDRYCKGLAKSFIQSYRQCGANEITEFDYLEDVTDFQHLVDAVIPLMPDLIFIPGYSRDAGTIIRTLRRSGSTALLLGGDGWGTQPIHKFAGDAIFGAFRTAFWHPALQNPVSRTFVKDFESRYGKVTRLDIPSAYDAVMLLAKAARIAESRDSRTIRDTLKSTQAFMGATGALRFDPNGDAVKQAVILKYTTGIPTFHTVVQP